MPVGCLGNGKTVVKMAKQLGNVTKQVVARAISISMAKAVAAADPSEIQKSAGAKAPASVTGQRQTTGEVVDYANAEKPRALPASREMIAATPNLPPRRAIPMHAAVISLVVDNGGRQDEGGVRPVGRTRAGGTSQRVFLRVVADHAAPLSITD